MQLLQWVTDIFMIYNQMHKILADYTQDRSGYFESFSDLQT